jgi:1,4-dihydroxy-2-naphthoate octaprenyltransferase
MKIPSFLILLRIPFSFYLLPVFLFALSYAESIDIEKSTHLFILLHLLIYPASNGFNSFQDKDKTSIGGLSNPPQPNNTLLYVSMALNLIAIAYSYWIHPFLCLLITCYIIASIAYSWKIIRLKKYPLYSFITVVFFQGFITYISTYLFCQQSSYPENLGQTNFLLPAIISSLMVAGAYPMTQIYQHEADKLSGDLTLSRVLGIKGTFAFSALMNTMVFIIMGYFLVNTNQSHFFYLFIIFVFPPLSFFTWWYNKVRKSDVYANFRYTMILNNISSISLVLYYLLIIILENISELPL